MEFTNRWIPQDAIGDSLYPRTYASQMEKPYDECILFNFMDLKRRLQPIRFDVPVNQSWAPPLIPIIISDDESSDPPTYSATTMNRPVAVDDKNGFKSK